MMQKTTFEELVASRQVPVTWKRFQSASYDPEWDEYTDPVFETVQVPARILQQEETEEVRREGTERQRRLRILLLARDLPGAIDPRDRFEVEGVEYRIQGIKRRLVASEVVGYELTLEG